MSGDLYTSGEYGERHPSWHVEDSLWKAQQIMRVLDPTDPDPPRRICDIGCGVGGVVAALDEILASRGLEATYTGYDIAPCAIERAKSLWQARPRLSFECRDVLTLNRLEYDLCLLMDILEHLEDPVAFVAALGGRGLSHYVIHLPLERNWVSVLRGRTDPKRNPSGHLHFFDLADGLGLLRRAGLKVVNWVYTPELELDIRLHRTLPSVAAYLPRRILFSGSHPINVVGERWV